MSVGDLGFFNFLREFAKVSGLYVTGLCLELRELSRFLSWQERNQSFKLDCRLGGVISLFDHQVFEFPNCLMVIHISLPISSRAGAC